VNKPLSGGRPTDQLAAPRAALRHSLSSAVRLLKTLILELTARAVRLKATAIDTKDLPEARSSTSLRSSSLVHGLL
jgi:hypothetical protein